MRPGKSEAQIKSTMSYRPMTCATKKTCLSSINLKPSSGSLLLVFAKTQAFNSLGLAPERAKAFYCDFELVTIKVSADAILLCVSFFSGRTLVSMTRMSSLKPLAWTWTIMSFGPSNQ